MQLKLSFVTGLLAASAFAAAAPMEQNKGISIDITKRNVLVNPDTNEADLKKVESHLNGLRAKYAKNLAAFEQNTGKAHKLKRELSPELKKRGTGSNPLTDDDQQTLWSGNIAFGTPAQTFPIDFDTGSSDTLVNKGVYNPSASSTSHTNGDQFSTAYGDGTTAQGTIYTDTLHIAGLSATNTAIGLSNTTFVDPSQGAYGISGMAYPQLAAFGSKYLPYFFRLKQAGAVTTGKFQFDLRTSGSTLFLGGTDSSKYSTTPVYTSLDSNQGFWQVPASVNGQGIQSIVDTGTTLIVAPPNEAVALFNQLGLPYTYQDGSYYAYYTCSNTPKVTFKFSSYTKTLSASSATFGSAGGNQCYLSVVGSDIGIDAWITGDAFLINTVAIFDTDNNRVGFANKK